MLLKSLYLYNFRNYDEAFVEFSPGINAVFGANAQGKTSLLEAVYFLISGKSFRAHHLSDMIRYGAPSFYLEAQFVKQGIDQTLKISTDGKLKKIIYNETPYQAFSVLLGILQGVIMTPDDSELIKGAPLARRQFLDLQIAQVDPLYVHYVMRYHKAMKQRNHLLRSKPQEAIESFEYEMARAGAYIISSRRKLVEDLNEKSRCVYERLSHHNQQEMLSLSYKTLIHEPLSLEEMMSFLMEQYKKMRKKESEIGSTIIGPHRDDLSINLEGKEARFFASEGQQRSCIASLKLAEWYRLRELAFDNPMIMIDDLGISLDHYRNEELLSQLLNLGQVFLSSVNPISTSSLEKPKRFIHIEQGKVLP